MAKMERVTVSARAKVNFTLDILGSEGGYHLLDSLVCTINLSDRVTARRRADKRVCVTIGGIGADDIPPGNNALRAAQAFLQAFGTQGADIFIERHIPVGAGLGSSSADAAGVLRALAKLYGASDMVRLKALADGLGSDTGYLLTGGWARMTGRGDRIAPVADMPPLYLLLLCPPSGVATAQCFAEYDRRGERYPARTQAAIDLLRREGARGARLFGNALTQAAASLNGEVAAALEAAAALCASGAGMTGSGSACYAVFGSACACRAAAARYAGGAAALCVHTVPTA